MKWPFVWRATYDEVKLENFTLRDALRNANTELRKHKVTIYQLTQELSLLRILSGGGVD